MEHTTNSSTGISFTDIEQALDIVRKQMPEFYGYVGYSRQSSSNYKTQGYVPVKFASKVAAFFGVSLDCVINSRITECLRAIEKGLDSEDLKKVIEDTVTLPLIPAGSNAAILAAPNKFETLRIEKRMLSKSTLAEIDENTVLYRAEGNAMNPLINDHDLLFIDLVNNRRITLKDDVYLVRYGSMLQLKQVQFLDHNKCNLISINGDYPMIKPYEDGVECVIVGKPFKILGIVDCSKLDEIR